MTTRMRWIKRRPLALAIALIGVVAISGTALAGHQTSGVKSYTGCLVSGDGVIIKIKEGSSPRSACTGGQVEAHFSGGDITKISVGSGLSLPNGGDNGEVRIELAAGQALPQNCTAGRVAEWNGSAWVCGVDNDTTYSAGTGLDLSAGNAFNIEPAYRLPDKACATAGQFSRGFDSGGVIQCSTPASSGVEVWATSVAPDLSDAIVLPNGEGKDLTTLALPVGTFLVTAVAIVSDRSGSAGDEEVSVVCGLRNAAFGEFPVADGFVDIGEEDADNNGPAGSAVVHGLVTLANPDTVRFTCTSLQADSDGDEAQGVSITAVKVGTLHTP